MNATKRPGWRAWGSLALVVSITWGLSQALQWWRDQEQAERVTAALTQQRVTAQDVLMFTTTTCPFCSKARRWLKQHQVPFQECNVETSATCMQQYEQQGSPGVPLLRVRGQWHLGFEPEWLIMALQKPSALDQRPKTAGSPRP